MRTGGGVQIGYTQISRDGRYGTVIWVYRPSPYPSPDPAASLQKTGYRSVITLVYILHPDMIVVR